MAISDMKKRHTKRRNQVLDLSHLGGFIFSKSALPPREKNLYP